MDFHASMMNTNIRDLVTLFPSPLDTWPVVPWKQNARKLWTVSPPNDDVEWDDWESQELLCVGYGVDRNGEVQHIEAEFEEPNFTKTGVEAVDNQVRDRILQQMKSMYQSQFEESVDAKKLITKANRAYAVQMVLDEAKVAQEIGPSAEPALRRAVDAAQRLHRYLEPDLALDSNVLSTWKACLASWEEDRTPSQSSEDTSLSPPSGMLPTMHASATLDHPTRKESNTGTNKPEFGSEFRSKDALLTADDVLAQHCDNEETNISEVAQCANDTDADILSSGHHSGHSNSHSSMYDTRQVDFDPSNSQLYRDLFRDEMQFILDLRTEGTSVGLSLQRNCSKCAFNLQPEDKFCPACGAKNIENPTTDPVCQIVPPRQVLRALHLAFLSHAPSYLDGTKQSRHCDSF
eukprot:m.1184204 g.1184204  ORF g.1184204 m.1184204 type:complete len:405 (-) comp24541_c0_seq5:10-1224(-)